METFLLVAFTSVLTAFFSNFAAPHLRARIQQIQSDRRIYRRTLRVLLEIEVYLERNLAHPMLPALFGSLLEHLRCSGHVLPPVGVELEKMIPQLSKQLQMQTMQFIPDKGPQLDEELGAAISELAAIDPILAFNISERHVIGPIQRMMGLVESGIKDVDPNATDGDIEVVQQFGKPLIDKTIQDLFNDVRNDQRKIAAKIGRKAARDLEERIKLTEKKRKDQIEELSQYVLNSLPAAPATQQTDSSEIALEIPE